MTTKTRAAIKAEHGAPLVVDEIELEDPGDEEVLVKLFATGICHSQLHQIFNLRAPMPVLLGHEGTGVILAAGSRVDHVRAGDRVMIQFVPRDLPEGQTVAARTKFRWRGAEYEADDVYTWAEHTLLNEQMVVPLRDDVATDVTSIIGCAVITGVGAALYTANVKAGQSVAVFGVGGVGTNVLAGARIAGADPIIAVDLQERKLEYARSLGATHTVNASDGEAAEAVKELTGGGVDFAFDTIGVEAASLQAVESVRAGVLGASRGGTAVIVGIGYEDLVLQRPRVFPYAERSLNGSMGGSMRPAHVMPQYVEWYREGKLPLEQLVTRRYDSLDDINEAVRALKDGEIDGRSIIVFDTP
jgi:Zn-dependent alcohol dehydrogenase